MKSSDHQIPKPVSVSQCVATVITLRRLIVVSSIVPLIVAASPLVVGVFLAIMDFMTAGFGFLLTIVGVVFTILGLWAINLYAPDAKQREEALSKSRISLPLSALLLGMIFISYVLDPVARWMGLSNMLTFSPKLPYLTAFQLSACMLLLGGAILSRFVGPISVGKNTSAVGHFIYSFAITYVINLGEQYDARRLHCGLIRCRPPYAAFGHVVRRSMPFLVL